MKVLACGVVLFVYVAHLAREYLGLGVLYLTTFFVLGSYYSYSYLKRIGLGFRV